MTPVETFTPEEQKALAPYFTNLDKPVFAIVNLPEVVKGALFARYSRSPKSVRRLFLDEFLGDLESADVAARQTTQTGSERAEQLYARVLSDYGDDSVAQLGGVHLACEGVSNVLTKILERGRLMAYLEQSTRYVPYTDRVDGAWKYAVPAELEGSELAQRFREVMDEAFDTYARWIPILEEHFRSIVPKTPGDSNFVYRQSIRAKALDTLRGMLPAAARSNVGLYGTGQAYEALLIRMRAEPLAEVRECADLMLEELRKVIPAFLTRVDQEERGQRWSQFLRETRDETAHLAGEILAERSESAEAEVHLTDFDPEGEEKVVAAALYAVSSLPDTDLLRAVRRMTAEERGAILRAYIGRRHNRRHKPGRAFERTSYRFDILADYGAYRDLQRHRLLTTEAQALTPDHGYEMPSVIDEVGASDDFRRVMERSAGLFQSISASAAPQVAPYAVCMAYRIRFYMEMNAREAMHVIELRTSPQGHPAYRRICQEMHRLIRDEAGHAAIAGAMQFVDYSEVELERLASERASEKKRLALSQGGQTSG
ncbi:MAG TPA: FAD-dependent thymidylate synthase [Dehalococcoidia bacterium]|nr:FAD-dependent thymidylate synthase [Dehalococcoidia bacterium]